MKKVAIGGDRLGAGKKMQVELHGYERSTHDLGYIWRSTASPGTLIPFLSIPALPGDTFDITLDSDIMTHPTLGPLLGSFKAQYDVFLCPIRLYNSWLHNNMLNIGRNIAQVKFPQLEMTNTNVDDQALPGGDLDNSQINPSCIFKYLGLSGVGMGAGGDVRYFNALPFVSYWDVYKNYYANKQEEIGAVIHTITQALVDSIDTVTISPGNALPQEPALTLLELANGTTIRLDYTGLAPIPTQVMIQLQYAGWKQLSEVARFNTAGAGFVTYAYNWGAWGLDYAINWRYRTASDINTVPPTVVTFDLNNIDAIRQEILAFPGNTQYIINGGTLPPYQYPISIVNDTPNALNSQEGLAVKTYQNDLFNNWISTEWIDGPGGITEVTAISTAVGDKFTLDTLNLSQKVYKMLNRIAISDGSYNSWIEVVYDQQVFGRTETPIYCGGLSKELVFQEIVSNSTSEGSQVQPLGTLAGKGVMAKKHKGGQINIKVAEPSYILGIFSLTPRIDYSQGNTWDMHLQTLDDLHKPALDEIGFQELIKEDMAWWDTRFAGGLWTQQSAGKQPAWINYMTAVNKCFGNFAIPNNEMFMTLNRRYQYDPGVGIFDMTTYIDPVKYNFIFANTAIDAQNFWVQIAVDITARRKMSAKIMPNL